MHKTSGSASVRRVSGPVRLLLVLLTLAGLTGAGGRVAFSSETEAFIARVAEARTLFRITVTNLREGRTDDAVRSLEQLSVHWQETVRNFRDNPPAIFTRTALFAETLDGTIARLSRAAEGLSQGRTDAALDELGPLRQDWIGMRRAAGLYGLVECLDEATAALDSFVTVRRTPPDLARAETRGEVIARAAVYRFALRRCDAFASQDMVAEGDYQRRVEAIMAALDVVDTALRLRDPGLLDRVLTDLKGFDLQLSQRYGG
ncbi:hypothetical protein [Phreatobacter sp.]|uniref:hypothetical protein n=1 Tax=Phreatobacter sp. TaxID=1966341 RepID=UPI003F72DCE3